MGGSIPYWIRTIVLIFFLVVYPQPSISSAPTLYDRPSSQPSTQPSSQPSMNPSMAPSSQPSETPSANPSQGCANTRTDCGWGIFNPWTCRCDCPAGICLDNNEQCYLPCRETINTNPWGGCSPGKIYFPQIIALQNTCRQSLMYIPLNTPCCSDLNTLQVSRPYWQTELRSREKL